MSNKTTFRALETENELLMEEKRKIEVHSANIRAIYEQKVADLEADTKQSKDQLRTGFAEKKSLLDQVQNFQTKNFVKL